MSDPVKSTTTKDDLFKTPEPPYGRSVFTKGADGALDPAEYKNKIPTVHEPAAGCGTKVTAFNVYLSGPVHGSLKYDLLPRDNINFDCANNDKTLGSCRGKGISTVIYKFEVEITFTGPLKDGFYGQLITRPSAAAANDNDVEFKDDTAKNDWVDKNWYLQPGQKKEEFPSVELDGQTVRWIDAPQALALNAVKLFVIVYAGACGKLTNLEIFKITYPRAGKATMEKITEADLKKEVGSFIFKQ
jgi:hypothetical protein